MVFCENDPNFMLVISDLDILQNRHDVCQKQASFASFDCGSIVSMSWCIDFRKQTTALGSCQTERKIQENDILAPLSDLKFPQS